MMKMVEEGKKETSGEFFPELELKEWERLNPQVPIRGTDISGWKQWLNWYPHLPGFGHIGHDIAVYVNSNNEAVIGLPRDTPVYAVAGGRVLEVNNALPKDRGNYGIQIIIEHRLRRGFSLLGWVKTLYSEYWHLNPAVRVGQKVSKGEKIGNLYADPGQKEGRLVHLHFMVRNGPRLFDAIDPALVFPEIKGPICEPLGELDFSVEGIGRLPIVITNFKKLELTRIVGR